MSFTGTTEDELWAYIRPWLVGKWERVEVVYPVGFPDAFGFFQGQTHFIELKIGKPSLAKLRPKQHEFAADATARGVPVWLCFGYRGSPHYYDGLQTLRESIPPFVRAPSQPRSRR